MQVLSSQVSSLRSSKVGQSLGIYVSSKDFLRLISILVGGPRSKIFISGKFKIQKIHFMFRVP
jgi:hypothetical protein